MLSLIHILSLKKETDALSQSRLKDLEKELAELQDKFRSMKAKWEKMCIRDRLGTTLLRLQF